MQVEIHPYRKVYICPFCKSEQSIEENLQYEDYVTYPMLWAECCNARAVLDPKSAEKYGIPYNGEIDFMEEIEEERSGKLPEVIFIPLLRILRVIGSNMYYATTIVHTVEDIKARSLKQNGFEDLEHAEGPEDAIGLGLPVDTYNAEDVRKMYPDINIDMLHGGIYVGLEVEELDGRKSCICYWGD